MLALRLQKDQNKDILCHPGIYIWGPGISNKQIIIETTLEVQALTRKIFGATRKYTAGTGLN